MIHFKNDDEKHAWDLYVAAAKQGLLCAQAVDTEGDYFSSEEIADQMLEARRERETLPSGERPRPRPGSGKVGTP